MQNDITNYLMFLADNDYQIIVELKDMDMLYEERNQVLFENLGVDYYYLENTCNLIVIDNEAGEVSYLRNNYGNGETINSVIGSLSIWYNDDGTEYGMYLGDKELYTITAEENSERMRISVIEKNTGNIIESRTFN